MGKGKKGKKGKGKDVVEYDDVLTGKGGKAESTFAYENDESGVMIAPLNDTRANSKSKKQRKPSKVKKGKSKRGFFMMRGVSVPNLEQFDSEHDWDEEEEGDEDGDVNEFTAASVERGVSWFRKTATARKGSSTRKPSTTEGGTGAPPPVPSQATKPKLGAPPPVPSQATKPKLEGAGGPPPIPSASTKPKLNATPTPTQQQMESGPPPVRQRPGKTPALVPPGNAEKEEEEEEGFSLEKPMVGGTTAPEFKRKEEERAERGKSEADIDRALKEYSRRVQELVEFYEKVDPDRPAKLKHCRALLKKYPPGNVAIAVKKKYGEFPEGWDKFYEEAQGALLFASSSRSNLVNE